ncbi:hypothetical protein JHK82_027623 [Glycine max]|nr:hypothetical protein JHK85_028269 [Glycine max]KAG5003613.1 hypothetical protein JHK86_027752 [Glycine max]KAG5126788.1 hypothetical protein JHK82_027623 [Glycine max]KAG5151396.1 hypothetical protein JHK84_027868 [Glycine max]
MTNTIVGLKPSLSLSLSIPLSHSFPFSSPLSLKPHPLFLSPKPHPFLKFANNNNNNELREQGNTQQQQQQKKPPNGSKEEEEEEKVNDWSNQRRTILGFNWRTLLDPDPDNVLALGLTGILTWASVQVLWQLLFISLAILTAAIKYSFIAALLVFILIPTDNLLPCTVASGDVIFIFLASASSPFSLISATIFMATEICGFPKWDLSQSAVSNTTIESEN